MEEVRMAPAVDDRLEMDPLVLTPASPGGPAEDKEGNKESLAPRCEPKGMGPVDPIAPVPDLFFTPFLTVHSSDVAIQCFTTFPAASQTPLN